MRVTNDIPLGCPLLLTVATINSVQTRKAYEYTHAGIMSLALGILIPFGAMFANAAKYGARFPTEIHRRGCHWIPRTFA